MISSYRFIDGFHSVWSDGSKASSKSLPSAREGEQNLVFVVTSGGWKGNLSLKRISKLNVGILCVMLNAAEVISSYESRHH